MLRSIINHTQKIVNQVLLSGIFFSISIKIAGYARYNDFTHRHPMSVLAVESFIIVGLTSAGKRFRPSDWSDRLCGVMSAFGTQRRLGYSPFVQPGTHEGEKCVFVDARIHAIEPLAYGFLVHFARDNDLIVRAWTPYS